MKKLLLILLMTLGVQMSAQKNIWNEKFFNEVDTTNHTMVLMDSASYWADILMNNSDTIYSYVSYYFEPDTIKVLVLITDDLSQYTEEELSWHSPIVYLERAYLVVDSNVFLNRKKKKYEHVIIWDWREYEWR